MAVLVGGTSWVIAGWISAYLVPVYLLAMALILLPINPARSSPSGAETGHPGPGKAAGDLLKTRSEPSQVAADDTVPADAAAEPLAPVEAATPTKRGRGRPRKAKAASKVPSEPVAVAPATWVEVGPGKFVRVESPEPPAPCFEIAEPTGDEVITTPVSEPESGSPPATPLDPVLVAAGSSIDLEPVVPMGDAPAERSGLSNHEAQRVPRMALGESTLPADSGASLPISTEAFGDRPNALGDASPSIVAATAGRRVRIAPRLEGADRPTGRRPHPRAQAVRGRRGQRRLSRRHAVANRRRGLRPPRSSSLTPRAGRTPRPR